MAGISIDISILQGYSEMYQYYRDILIYIDMFGDIFRRGLSEVMEFSSSRSSCPWHHSGRVQEQVENCFVRGNAVGQALRLFLSFLWATFFFVLSMLYLGHSFSYCCALGLCIESTENFCNNNNYLYQIWQGYPNIYQYDRDIQIYFNIAGISRHISIW